MVLWINTMSVWSGQWYIWKENNGSKSHKSVNIQSCTTNKLMPKKSNIRGVLLTALHVRLFKFNDWKYDDLLSFFELYCVCGLFLYERKKNATVSIAVSLAAGIADDVFFIRLSEKWQVISYFMFNRMFNNMFLPLSAKITVTIYANSIVCL